MSARDVRFVRGFHKRTEHAPGRPAAGGPFDPANEPAKTKLYRGLAPVALADRWDEPGESAQRVLSGVASRLSGTLDRAQVSRLLFLCNGVTRTIERGGRRHHFRAAPSAGALYPIEVYVVCAELPDLPAGVHHHDPVGHVLRTVREGDLRGALAGATAESEVARAPASLVLTGIPWRTTWKYGARGYRHLFWDAGAILANLLAAAEAAGLPASVLTAFADAEVSRLLDLGAHLPFEEWPLVVVALGSSGPAAPAAEAPAPLRQPVDPLSRRVVREPAIGDLHGAGALPGEAVAPVRERLAQQPQATATEGPLQPPSAADGEATVQDVILRRGSTRAFDPTRPAPAQALDWGLGVAMRDLPSDLAAAGRTPLTTFVAVHAVEDSAPAGYRWTRRGLERITEQPRARTAHLCLDQALGGTAAFTTFFCAELDPLVQAAGARGYRLAQLAAGVAAGRLQLAAFAVGLGGTGLTFFDAAVRDHFATSTDPMLVTALGWPAYRPRPGALPSSR